MSEVITVQDLENLKKHEIFEAEVITGKVGGLAAGANITSSTNGVTGQIQDTLPKILSDLGMQVQSWPASVGGVLTNPAQIFLNDIVGSTGKDDYYAWAGNFPKTVAAGTDPSLPGSGYVKRSDKYVKVAAREALRRSYAEAGYTLVSGSFEAGGTLASATDVLLHESSGKAYSGAGPFPQTVAPNTNPASGGFTDRSGSLLRGELSGPSGAGLVGVSSGNTVQQELNNIHKDRNNLTLSKVKVWAELDLIFPGYDSLLSTYGYNYIYPQAIGFCDDDSEFYITYTVNGGSNTWAWIVAYDSITKAVKSVFSAGDFNSEGVHVVRIDGVKYLITLETFSTSGLGKTGVYILPANLASINMTRLTATRICSTQQFYQLSGLGERLLMEVNAGNSSPSSIQVRSQLRIFNVRDLIASSTPVAVGSVSLSRNTAMTVKRQSIGLGDGEILCGYGAIYLTTAPTYTVDEQYGSRILSINGLEKAEFIASPKRVVEALQPHVSGTISRLENEGCAYSAISGSLKPYAVHIIGDATAGSAKGILILEQGVQQGEDGIELISCQSLQGMVDNNNDTSIQILERPFDRTQNKQLTTLAQILDVMNRDGIQTYQFYNSASWAVTDINGNTISPSTTVTIHNNNAFTYFVSVLGVHTVANMLVTGNSGGPYSQTMSMFVQATDSAVRPEFLRSAGVVFGNNGLPAFNHYTNSSAGTLTMHRYMNGLATSATIAGSIVVNNATTSTAFNTTSDETLKNKGDVYADGLGKICALVDGGALRHFTWKANDVADYGFMAQTLEQYAEKAVCIDNESGLYQVDYSKLVPDLISAVYSLKQEIDDLRRKLLN